jgi:CrcB protein
MNILAVGGGGFIGAVLRYLISALFAKHLGIHACLATFAVNFTGCFLIGILAEIDFKNISYIRHFMVVGVLGGFTTFSAFGFETLSFLKEADYFKAFVYVSSTLVICLAAVYLGSLSYKYFN